MSYFQYLGKLEQRTILLRLLLILLFFLVVTKVFAEKPDKTFYGIHQEYVGIRPLAMGNAFTAVGGDYNTLFYNPAGLSTLKEKRLNINIVRLGLTTGENSFLDLYNDIKDISEKDKTTSTTEMAAFIESKYGKSYYARMTPLSFIWARPNIGFAFIPIDFSLSMSVHNQVGPAIKLSAYQDSTLAFGYGFRLPEHKELGIGVTVKSIYRAYFGKLIPALELASDSDFIKSSDAKEGGTVDFDLGFIYDFPYETTFRPTFGLNIRNVTDNGFTHNMHLAGDESTRPPDLQRRVDVGMMVPFNDLWKFKPLVAVDIRDIGHDNWTFLKGLHLGTEFKWEYDWWLRGSLLMGLKQGYLTYGVSLQGLWFLVEAVSYANEIGTKDLRRKDRVYMMKLSFYF